MSPLGEDSPRFPNLLACWQTTWHRPDRLRRRRQRWPAAHALDAALLFWLALELALAGTSWHAVADEGDAVRDIAAVTGLWLGLPVEAVPQETYGPLGPIFATDQPSSSTHTRAGAGRTVTGRVPGVSPVWRAALT
jgi:hypothetical protein